MGMWRKSKVGFWCAVKYETLCLGSRVFGSWINATIGLSSSGLPWAIGAIAAKVLEAIGGASLFVLFL